MFEFLFKYPLESFRQGAIELASPWLLYAFAVLIATVTVPTLLRYARVGGNTGDRLLLNALRVAALATVLFCLFRPVLVLSTAVPERGVLGILLDDSRSMGIDDGAPRADFIRRAFDPNQGELLARLAERFDVRLFRFAARTAPVDDAAQLDFSGAKTDLGKALDYAQRALSGAPLAGLLVVSDGADNTGAELQAPLLALRAQAIPVHSVGLGRETFAKDLELSQARTPRRVLKGTALAIELSITQQGFTGRSVPLLVEEEGRIVASQTVELRPDGEPTIARVYFTATEPGPRRLRFYLPPQPGELLEQNNELAALVLVSDHPRRILYFEGEPRFEVKFIRRALAKDDNIQVVTLVRTAEHKYYRLGIDEPDELADGFPAEREALFAYSGLIIGSVEAGYFSPEQLEMINEFASRRGGGVLFLGGKQAFAEGGYADTPIAQALPVVLDPGNNNGFSGEFRIEPTAAGKRHPVLRIAASEEASAERWSILPALSVVNPIRRIKPGATTLLQGIGSDASNPYVTLAFQRYGRGKTVALAVRNSWLWQMHHEVPLEDPSHENFWRQLLRWLVSSVPERLEVTVPTAGVVPGESVAFTAQLRDAAYSPLENGALRALLLSPTGEEFELAMERSAEHRGEYHGIVAAQEQGLYELRVQARDGEQLLGESTAYFDVKQNALEYHRAGMRRALLERIAMETGGRFFTPNTASALPAAIAEPVSGATVVKRLALWDMPALFLLAAGLVCAEWLFRRWRGLV